MTPAEIHQQSTAPWIDVTPAALWRYQNRRKALRSVVRALARLQEQQSPDAIRKSAVAAVLKSPGRTSVPLVFCINVLCDLNAQGWTLRLKPKRILARAPINGGEALVEKARVRSAHIVERDAQLLHPAVGRFIKEMERPRLHKGEWRSVYSLMRDGRDLASILSAIASDTTEASRHGELRNVIDPYLQVAQAGRRCEFTGLDLFDVWRYFRHTWTTTYQSTPGRKLFFLVRDRAAPNHPVVGIAALGSPIVQLSVRDQWIGWTPTQLIEVMRQTGPGPWLEWLKNSLEDLLGGIYTKDFLRQRRITRAALRRPTVDVIEKLKTLAAKERRVHHLYPEHRRHKSAGRRQSVSWSAQAETHLFRSKRALALAELLTARLQMQGADVTGLRSLEWERALETEGMRRAIAAILRYTKAAHVGVEVMDVTVCGAVAPYNHLLGGKLVSLLMASPYVREEYRRRYRRASSIIASSMAGRAVVRSPRLVLLGTTSLYGVAPSQYNRLRMPAEVVGGPEGATLAYECLGKTAGYGSYHFSRETMAALEPLLGRLQRGRPVNSIFGEGVNPKLRKVRAALDTVGLPSDLLLQHGSPRIVYGIALASNFREILLGLQSRPRYVVPNRRDASAGIVDFWRTRWLTKRVQSEEVLRAIATHALTSPVQHGARVPLPHSGERRDSAVDESAYPESAQRTDRLPSGNADSEDMSAYGVGEFAFSAQT